MGNAPTLLVVDNYDSFVYNIVQYLAELGAHCVVRRNDHVSVDDLKTGDYDGVVISPGPGHPRDSGACLDIIRYCGEARLPMLGICLGHQALAQAYGASVISAPELRHGRSSPISHTGSGVFIGLPNPVVAGRYHSLVVDESTVPDFFEVTAHVNGLVMGLRHRELPLEGVQFHPESVLTQQGYTMLANWLVTLGFADATQTARSLIGVSESLRQALPVPLS